MIGISGGSSGVVLPAQIGYYHINKSVIGLLFFSFSTGYLLAAVANGALMRRFGPRGELMLGAGTYAAVSLACATQPPYLVLVGLTTLLGIGGGIIESALNAYLAALPRRVVLLNLLHAFYGVGALAGPVLAAAMFAHGLSWGWVYLLLGAVAVPLMIGFVLRFPRELPSSPAEPDELVEPNVESPVFGTALRHRAVLLAGLFLTVYVGVEISIGNWGYSLLTQQRGQGALLAGWVVSGYWFGFTLGRFVLSALAERFGVGPAGLAWGCLTAMMLSGLVIWLVPGTVGAIAGLLVFGVSLGPIYPLTIAVLPKLMPNRLVPTAIGMLVGASIVGGAFFPWLAGTLAETVGLGSLLPFTLLLGVILLANWWRLSRRLAAVA
jgi:fucose permease